MARKRPEIIIKSYGRYTAWDRTSKELPKVIKHTLDIEAAVGVEFGMILSVKGGKGEMLDYEIKHPPFCNDKGEIEPSFIGSYFVNSNDFLFFLGDTVWEPIDDKLGRWQLTVSHNGQEVARKIFHLV